MSNFEQAYMNLVTEVITRGEHRPSRAGFTVSAFGATFQTDCLERGYFPILTQRKIFPAGILGELEAFLKGSEDLQTFKDAGCNYWDINAAEWAPNKHAPVALQKVGRIYGAQWRNWTGAQGTVDQLANLVTSLRTDPYSRRHLLTTYNPAELAEGCLPPCHVLAQFNVRTTKQLDCVVTMRSVDLCLGLPSDVILYAALMLVLCNETGCTPGKLTFMLGDTHVYRNHIDQFQEHASRPMHPLPQFKLAKSAGINTFVAVDLQLYNYQHSGVLPYAFNK